MKAYDVLGLTSEADLDKLYNLAKAVPENGIIVEVGSLFGRTAVALAEGAVSSTKIYCIDYFDEFINDHFAGQSFYNTGPQWEVGKIYNRKDEFQKYTKEYANIIPLQLSSRTSSIYHPYKGEPIDLFFLDASHKNPSDIMNIMYFRTFLKPNAVICGHDYALMFPDVIKNVKFLEQLYKTPVIRYANSSMWAIRT